jgi:acyl-CoA synthetase (AMP-forming)/AMP-acid ligase II
MLTHRNIAANTESIVSYLGLSVRDRVMVVLPFYYVYGLSLLHTHIAVGGCLVIDNRFAFPNAVLRAMQEHAVTGFAGVPSTFAFLLHRSNIRSVTLPSLRYVTQAGGPMPPARIEEWRRVMPDLPFYVMYGATEASARLTYLPPSELPRRTGSIGRAIPGVEVRVVRDDGGVAAPGEVGELVARGANMARGYWRRPEESAECFGPHGYRTGDLGFADEEGFLYLVGRRTEMLKIGAHRVSPLEIEQALHEHQAVHEAAVIGAADELLGEVAVAYVVLRDGEMATAQDVLAFARARLPEHKVPARIMLLPELPKTPAGKLDKRALRRGGPEADQMNDREAGEAVAVASGIARSRKD